MSEIPEGQINENEILRYKRLIFYKDEVEKINDYLSDFLDSTQAKAALIIDTEGHLVTKMGYTKSFDTASLSALIAGSFASTKEVAKLLGEEEFTEIFHQGKVDSIHISIVQDRVLIVIVFDNRTTIGMVKFYSQDLCEKIGSVMLQIQAKMESGESTEEEEIFKEDFTQSMKDKLDDLFGL